MNCLHPECANSAYLRGLCKIHYGQMKRITGKWNPSVMEIDLELAGLLLPKYEMCKRKKKGYVGTDMA